MTETRNLHVVLVNCGGMSRRWVEVSRELAGVELVGFVDIDTGAATSRPEEYGPAASHGTDMTRMLDDCVPDVIFDCTSPEAHTEVTIEALSRSWPTSTWRANCSSTR